MLKFLDCYRDSEQWDNLVNRITKDPHFSSAYYRAFDKAGLAIWAPDEGIRPTVMQPFHHQGGGWIGNAYNFGGIIGDSFSFASFAKEFDGWKTFQKLNERCLVSSFSNANTSGIYLDHPVTKRFVVCVPLKDDIIASSGYRTTTKQCIRRAAKRGVVSSIVPSSEHNARLFEDIYTAAMMKKNAAPHWFYARDFFHNVLTNLFDRSVLINTKIDGELESACILIFGGGVCYYHWAATKGNYPKDGVNHFQVDFVINWARSQGMKLVCLGGALEPGDALLTFKLGFSQWRLPCFNYVSYVPEVKVA